MSFNFFPGGGVAGERLRLMFLKSCAEEGVLSNGNVLPSTAHDEYAMARTAEAMTVALKAVRAVVEPATEAVGQAIETGFRAADGALGAEPNATESGPQGFLEILERTAGHFELQGWLLLPDGPPDVVEVVARAGMVEVADRTERPDLAQGFPDVPNANQGGFAAHLSANSFAPDGAYDFVIRARRGDQVVFLSRILSDSDQPARDEDRPEWRGDGTLYV
jgi:hypothetical protein